MYSGKVIHGNGYGRQLGYPTANLDIKKEEQKKENEKLKGTADYWALNDARYN